MGNNRCNSREVTDLNIKLKEDKFHVRAFFAPCACRCKFCCLGDYSHNKRITFEDYENVMYKFANIQSEYGMRLRSFIYNCPEHDYIAKQIALYASLPMERSEYTQLDLNGTRIKSSKEIETWIDYLIKSGIEKIAFSWFGCEETHDEFVHRKGYFSYLKKCAQIAKSKGIPVISKVFLHKKIIKEIAPLLAELDTFSTSIIVAFMEYSGNAKYMEHDFLTGDDFTSLLPSIKGHMKPSYISKFKTEREWIDLAKNALFPQFNIVDYVLYIDSDNIATILKADVSDIIQSFREMNSTFQNSFGTIAELASVYGNTQCEILYECRDILRKWLDKYYDDKQLNKTQLFSFTHNSVEWKVYERL